MATNEKSAESNMKADVCDFTDKRYSLKFLSALHNLQSSGEFTDVVLCSEELRIPCHKVVLSAASPYFRAMFASGLQESQSGQVELKDIDSTTLALVIKYIYSAQVSITTSNVQSLIQACDTLHFDSLNTACEDFVIAHTDPSNCIGFYQFARLFHLKRLEHSARVEMLTKFKQVVQGQEFLQLSKEGLIEYISDDDLEVFTEDTVFDAVVLWTNHDPDTRNAYFDRVMEFVRLPYCTSTYLCHDVMRNTLMTSETCQSFLEEARMFHMLLDNRHEMHGPRTVPRTKFNLERHLVLVGGLNVENKENKCCWYFKEDKSSWELLAKLPIPKVKFYSVCALHRGILITGGYHGANKKDCWLFDTQEKKWKALALMLEGRCKHGSVVHGGCVYVLGGEDDNDRPLSSVEVMDMRTRQWTAAPPMPKALSDPLVVSHGRYIFVLGGIEEGDATSSATFMYDPVWAEWTVCSGMLEPCRLGSAVSFNDVIYVVGGNTRTCQMYNPATDTWKRMKSSPGEKHGNAPAVVWQGNLLLAGGDIDNTALTSLIEIYDADKDKWSAWHVSLREPLSCHHLLNVDLYLL